MSKLNDLPGRALDIATQVGETVRDRIPDQAIKWVETGAALGAIKTGGKVATRFIRRNPLVAAAAAAGAGLLWYAARRRAKQAQEGPIEGQSRRIQANRAEAADDSSEKQPRRRRTTSAQKKRTTASRSRRGTTTST